MKATKDVLFLTLRTFSLTGGIEKVNRALSKVLANLNSNGKIKSCQLISMYDELPDTSYTQPLKFAGFNGKRLQFAFKALHMGIKSDVIILSHINLLVFAWLIKKIRPNTSVILMAHGIEIWHKLSPWKTSFLKKCEIWAVSRFTAEKMAKQHQLSNAKIKVLNNSLDPFFVLPATIEKPDYLLKKYHLDHTRHILFTLTRLSYAEQYKGYDRVLNVFAQLVQRYPDLHYILAGKADQQEQIRVQELIQTNGLEKHVTLAGYLPEEEVRDHYLLADAFVMPSSGEGFGISFIEATACGCPVIAGNKDGSTDALLDGKLGILIDPTNEQELVGAIIRLVENGRSIERALLLQQECEHHFGFKTYEKKVADLLKATSNEKN